MTQYKTPGIYIEEKSVFPNSVAEVPTAVPAFIGYTQLAANGSKSLHKKPMRISSLLEYHQYFGYGPEVKFSIDDTKPGNKSDFKIIKNNIEKNYNLNWKSGKYMFYWSLCLFFENGGGPCYIVSIGNYGDEIKKQDLSDGIDLLTREQEPTIVVIPEAILLSESDCAALQQAMLNHCGNVMKNRFAILDIYNGYLDRNDSSGDVITSFRNNLSSDFLKFGAAYYPWINTTIVPADSLSYRNIDNQDILISLLKEEVDLLFAEQTDISKATAFKHEIEKIATSGIAAIPDTLNQALIEISGLYKSICDTMRAKLNLLPPSSAMAGVYTQVDNSRGVWKAPANVTVNSVVSPAVNMTDHDQGDLNISMDGKSINAIRSFIGRGVLVWGARTLDGNNVEWRYVNVRRTIIMLEESINYAIKAFVFEANNANTWLSIKHMITNFLTAKWNAGALAGAKPDEAFGVHVGLGSTMSPNDILDGILNITVHVALSRPAEFLVITFRQQMQKS